MKKKRIVFLIAVILGTAAYCQDDKETAIKQTALDYADGFYSCDFERFEPSVHPDFNKVIALKLPQTGKTFLQYSTVSQLVEYIKTKAGCVEFEKRKTNIKVLTANENIAAVKLTSAFYNDFLCIVNFNGDWKIVNVLWSAGPDTPNLPPSVVLDPETEKLAVENTINNYYSGIYSASVEKLKQAIHPEVSFAQLRKMKETGKYAIERRGASFIAELTRAGYLKTPEDKRSINIEVLDFMNEMAFAKVTTEKAISYIQLQLIDQQWNIINVLIISATNG